MSARIITDDGRLEIQVCDWSLDGEQPAIQIDYVKHGGEPMTFSANQLDALIGALNEAKRRLEESNWPL